MNTLNVYAEIDFYFITNMTAWCTEMIIKKSDFLTALVNLYVFYSLKQNT